MILCRICSDRPVTTTMPRSGRPCCQVCRDRIDHDLARLRVSSKQPMSPREQAKQRHPAGKRSGGWPWVYRYHYNEVVTD